MSEEKKIKEVSRRKFMVGAGASLAAVALTGGLGGLLAGCETKPAATTDPGEKTEPTAVAAAASAAWPVAYVKLDPDKAADRGYQAYKEQGG